MRSHFLKGDDMNYRCLCSLIILILTSYSFPLPAIAQLNTNCVVSILNRTVAVQQDGSWVLPNIPAGFGLVRARATCVENGLTKSGQSEYFTISANRMNAIVPIQLGNVEP